MKFAEPILLFLGSFLSLGFFGIAGHLVFKLAESKDMVDQVTFLVPTILFVGVLLWFVMIMWALLLVIKS